MPRRAGSAPPSALPVGSCRGHCSLPVFNQQGFSWETVARSLQTSLPAPPCRLPSAASRQLGSQSAHASCPAWHRAPAHRAPREAGRGGRSPGALRAGQSHSRAPALPCLLPWVPHPVASAAVSGAVRDTPPCPPLGDTSGGIPERWGTRRVWGELRSPSRKQVSPRLGDRLPLEVRPVPGPQSRPHPCLALGSPPPAPGGSARITSSWGSLGYLCAHADADASTHSARGGTTAPGPFPSGAWAEPPGRRPFHILSESVQPPRARGAGWVSVLVRPQALGAQRLGRAHPAAAQTSLSLANWSP